MSTTDLVPKERGSPLGLFSPAALLLGLCAAAGGTAHAQRTAVATRGVVTGLVQDSATRLPVGYALIVVVGTDQRIFASESGRFRLTGVQPGRVTLRAQQIGYRSATLVLQVNPTDSAPGAGPGLVIELARQAVVLPEIVVQGDACSAAGPDSSTGEVGSILDEAFRNAERLLALQKSYPFRGAFDKSIWWLNSARARVRERNTMFRFDSRDITGYRRGSVLEGPRGSGESWNYFSPADLARYEFRLSHCFWYGGRDSSIDGYPGYRIDFAPSPEIQSADWAGSLLIDSATMTLTRSRSRLMNLDGGRTAITSAECTVLYRPFAPTLLQEFQAACMTTRSGETLPVTIERWVLRAFEFVKRRPVEPTVP